MLPCVDHLALQASPESERGKEEAVVRERVKRREPAAELDTKLFGLPNFANQRLFIAADMCTSGKRERGEARDVPSCASWSTLHAPICTVDVQPGVVADLRADGGPEFSARP
jgi:hypothetical protein